MLQDLYRKVIYGRILIITGWLDLWAIRVVFLRILAGSMHLQKCIVIREYIKIYQTYSRHVNSHVRWSELGASGHHKPSAAPYNRISWQLLPFIRSRNDIHLYALSINPLMLLKNHLNLAYLISSSNKPSSYHKTSLQLMHVIVGPLITRSSFANCLLKGQFFQ